MADFFIADYIPVSLLDYPGKIASVVFTYGCNLRCRYCHNPELVIGRKPANRLNDFFEHLNGKDIEGVAVTGGEPLVSPGIAEFLKKIKGLGCGVKLDTNGFLPAKLERVCKEGLADFVSVDLKAFSQAGLSDITRAEFSQDSFFETIDILGEYDVPFEVRHTLWEVPAKDDVRLTMSRAGLDRISLQLPIKQGAWLDKRFNIDVSVEEVENIFSDWDITLRNQ